MFNITYTIFVSVQIQCELKKHLLIGGQVGKARDTELWWGNLLEDSQWAHETRWKTNILLDLIQTCCEYRRQMELTQIMTNGGLKLLVPLLECQDFQTE